MFKVFERELGETPEKFERRINIFLKATDYVIDSWMGSSDHGVIVSAVLQMKEDDDDAIE